MTKTPFCVRDACV